MASRRFYYGGVDSLDVMEVRVEASFAWRS